jgi:hypothetical protein
MLHSPFCILLISNVLLSFGEAQPVKLGLKNVKAITKITYSVEEPRDYWAERGYSRYDGI